MDGDMSVEDLLAASKRRLSVNIDVQEALMKTKMAELAATAKESSSTPSSVTRRTSLTINDLMGSPAEAAVVNSDHVTIGTSNNNNDEAAAVSISAEEKGEGSQAPKREDEREEEDEDDEEEEDEEEEDKDVSTDDLLAAVQGRMEQQKLMDEVKALKQLLGKKDDEIKTLNGQLKMAISTKQSLLIANAELEQQHEKDMNASVRWEEDLRTASRIQMNMRAEIEKDFMNDLTKMAERLATVEQQNTQKGAKLAKLEAQLVTHMQYKRETTNDLTKMAERLAKAEQEISDKEDKICLLEAQLVTRQTMDQQDQPQLNGGGGHGQLHNGESQGPGQQYCADCVEKTEIIARLQKKVHALEKVAPRQETDKVRFYKAKLGL